MALTPSHFLANLLDPRFKGKQLVQHQIDDAMDHVGIYYPDAIGDILKFRANGSPFCEVLFSEQSLRVSPLIWWSSLKNSIDNATFEMTVGLFSALSAGIERLFSSFGLIHSKLRNQLGTEKAAKLVAIFKSLNKRN